MWLNVCILRTEGFAGPVYCQHFQSVDYLTAAVPPGADRAFGGLILEDRAQCRQDWSAAYILCGS